MTVVVAVPAVAVERWTVLKRPGLASPLMVAYVNVQAFMPGGVTVLTSPLASYEYVVFRSGLVIRGSHSERSSPLLSYRYVARVSMVKPGVPSSVSQALYLTFCSSLM